MAWEWVRVRYFGTSVLVLVQEGMVWYGMVSHLYLPIVLGAREPWNPIAAIAVRCHQVSEASCSVKRPFLEAFGGNPAMKRFVIVI